jgi:glucose-1-phosphate adenylyltransferase
MTATPVAPGHYTANAQSMIGRALRSTLAVVLAGGRGSRLGELTEFRSKPAVPFGGKYRIIDFTLSNCLNSGLNRICILTQYRSHSLIRHVELGWAVSRREFDEFVEILPAQERHSDSGWYQGTGDAVYQNLDIIEEHRPEFVLILAGDHVYKMDYGMMMATHLAHDAEVTVGCIGVPLTEASQFGVMEVDGDGRVVGFSEKPIAPRALPDAPDTALASMGIYLFRATRLFEILRADAQRDDSRHDFGADIVPALVARGQVAACPFVDLATGRQSYWRDVGTLDAYWHANLELAAVTPPLDLYDRDWPIRTAMRQAPPAKFVFDEETRRGIAIDSLVASGCIVSGATVRHSVLSNDVVVDAHSEITHSVVLPEVVIGRHCRIHHAVIDAGCRIPDGTEIGCSPATDAARYAVSPAGVVLVTPRMLGQDPSHGL